MPRGRPRKTTEGLDPSKAVRLTIRLDEDTAAMFNTIAAIKRMKLEDLGLEAIKNVFQKYKNILTDFKAACNRFNV